jgi:hypothetical protein
VQSAARAFPRRGATVRLPLRGQGSAPGLAPRRMDGTGHRPLTAARLEREIVFPARTNKALGLGQWSAAACARQLLASLAAELPNAVLTPSRSSSEALRFAYRARHPVARVDGLMLVQSR